MSRPAIGDWILDLPAPVRALLVGASLLTLLAVNQLELVTSRVHRNNDLIIQSAELLYVPDIKVMRTLTLGYDQAAADLLWVRTISYFARHFLSDRKYAWLEHFVDQIITLDPRFRNVYHWAGTNVLYGRTFIDQNVRISNRFYKAAIKRFPNDYEAAYRLGLNFYVEMKGTNRAERRAFREQGLAYLELAANTPGAPPRLRSLVASISTKLGKEQLALQYLLDQYIRAEDPAMKAKLKARMNRLKAARSTTALAEAADAFRARWKATLPYTSPALFGLLGEPARFDRPDQPWLTMTGDISISPTARPAQEGTP